LATIRCLSCCCCCCCLLLTTAASGCIPRYQSDAASEAVRAPAPCRA
jgi:hypothetical protein